jgi:hypothetical protein
MVAENQRMNRTRTARSLNREANAAAPTETTHRLPAQATGVGRNGLRSNEPARQSLEALPSTVHQVVEGFIDSLQSTGEGVLPIVLILQPELSTCGIPESDAEIARRGRRQSAAEKRFFRTIEPALRDALGTILDRAAHAAISSGDGLRKRRETKDKTVMAAGGRTSTRKAHLHLPRATCPAD